MKSKLLFHACKVGSNNETKISNEKEYNYFRVFKINFASLKHCQKKSVGQNLNEGKKYNHSPWRWPLKIFKSDAFQSREPISWM